jgi:glycosyltransferase involved in cell wall biosynthesis
MRVLVFHGYLLQGTGSNVYNASLAPALAALGHEVHLFAQEPRPEVLDWVDAVGRWPGGELRVEARRDPARLTVYKPEIGGLLPVYVSDTYEGFEARPFPDLSAEELDAYVERNVAAVRDVLARARPDVALANHLVMGPAILARSLWEEGIPYAVKVHGSALEYTVKPHPGRFLPYAREGVAPAGGVLVGSRHTAESLWAAVPEPGLREKTRLGPPGVDVDAFRPLDPHAAEASLRALGDDLGGREPERQTGSAFDRDVEAVARDVRRLADGSGPLVAFVGKLIVSKGVDLLLAAWPLVLERVPDARLAVVGFGAYDAGLEALAAALGAGDLDAMRAIAEDGRAREGGPRAPLGHLLAFLDALDADEPRRAAYVEAAAGLPGSVTWVGRLEHGELARLLPACGALVVPSTFPEAFGMVAAEAAACGVLPVSAAHSGLAEVSAALADGLPEGAGGRLSFPVGDDAVPALADRVAGWLTADPEEKEAVRKALRTVAEDRFGWSRVAAGVIAAAQGDLEALPPVPSDSMPPA